MTNQPSGSQRRLIAVSEEDAEYLRASATILEKAHWDNPPEVLRSIADRYEDGITEEEAGELVRAHIAYVAEWGDTPADETLRAKLMPLTHPDNPGGQP